MPYRRLCLVSRAPQDALEFFQYLLELMTRAERAAGARLGCDDGGAPTADAFAYQLEDRKQVQYFRPLKCYFLSVL